MRPGGCPAAGHAASAHTVRRPVEGCQLTTVEPLNFTRTHRAGACRSHCKFKTQSGPAQCPTCAASLFSPSPSTSLTPSLLPNVALLGLSPVDLPSPPSVIYSPSCHSTHSRKLFLATLHQAKADKILRKSEQAVLGLSARRPIRTCLLLLLLFCCRRRINTASCCVLPGF